jgi:hypothetical protein
MASNIDGLSVVTKDVNFGGTDDTKFMSLQFDSTTNKPIFVAGTASEDELGNVTYKNIAHGKFNKLSFVNNTPNTVRPDIPDTFEKGIKNYLYVDETSGEIKTNSIDNIFELQVETTNGQLKISSSTDEVYLSIVEIKQLKELLKSGLKLQPLSYPNEPV